MIKVQIHDWSVKRVLINLGSFTDILYSNVFKGMNMDTTEILPFESTLVDFSSEHEQVLGHFSAMTIFGSGDNSKVIKEIYLIVNASPHYNIIIGKPSFNAPKIVLSDNE